MVLIKILGFKKGCPASIVVKIKGRRSIEWEENKM